MFLRTIRGIHGLLISSLFLFPLLIVAIFSRVRKKTIDIGIGPEPLINNLYHKQALSQYGWQAETFVTSLYYITDEFDQVYLLPEWMKVSPLLERALSSCVAFYASCRALLNYKVLYFYFNGGPIAFIPGYLWCLEPFIYRVAGIKTLVMPYGGDVQDMSRSRNLLFKHAMSIDYPEHRLRKRSIEKKIDLWTNNASHIISGVEWVDYLYYWDTLMLAHFAIDLDRFPIREYKSSESETFKILHAPNHREIKGTKYLVEAVESLQSEGFNIELIMLEKVSNKEVIRAINEVDLVADQFIVGWYAMFAIEAMASGKPVLCYLRSDLIELYENAGLVERGEIPLISVAVHEIEKKLRLLVNSKENLAEIGGRSRKYVEKYHSLDSVGQKFNEINIEMGL